MPSNSCERQPAFGSFRVSGRWGAAPRLVGAVWMALLVGGCLVDPGDQRYTLASINGDPLPAPYEPVPLADPVWEVMSGSLTLHSDTTLTFEFVIRCRPDLVPGSCGVANDGRNRIEGAYSRASQSVWFGDQPVPMTFGPNTITIQFGGQTVLGFVPPQTYQFRR